MSTLSSSYDMFKLTFAPLVSTVILPPSLVAYISYYFVSPKGHQRFIECLASQRNDRMLSLSGAILLSACSLKLMH